uniref:NADH-ubiquinone oxidoreductase chain 2 n=1 Tax=Trigoniophthalmus alternatus TaxID=50637 RepID=B2BS99_9INSE|nr:NADH dehydrogenase subunit 2 [Trigoniophthalmus alternatus]ABS57552.1 NADH dehydrogenase subunit 2 [Trigoniophthalmus alternatus]
MQLNPANLLFMTTLVSGTLISVSSTSWFGAWIGLEINLMSFIPLMSNGTNQRSTEASLKYFLTQALGSILLILSAIYLYSAQSTTSFINMSSLILINSSLLLKMGSAPFHFWFPMVMNGISWFNNIILMTWQKIAPMIILSYTLTSFKFLMIMTILMSSLVGGLGGLNQTSLQKIMAYSSINHISWIIMAMTTSELLWMTYFTMYTMMSISVILIFNSLNIYHINQIYDSMKMNQTIKLMLGLNLLSLGGLPPFLGFLSKWIVMQEVLKNNSTSLLLIMVFTSLLTLFYYIRIMYSSMTISFFSKNWMLSGNNYTSSPSLLMLLTFISVLSMPAFLTLVYF